MEYFNRSEWEAIAKLPDWPSILEPRYQALLKSAQNSGEAKTIKEAIRSFFEDMLTESALALGGPDPQLDEERRRIIQAVIHHSNRAPGYYTLPRLNAVHLLNLYVPHCSKPGSPPLSSNHFGDDGKMVFFGYHWWVEEVDGSVKVIRLLPDGAIGWQAGNWEVNCQSIAICINDDLTKKTPSPAVLAAVRQILQSYRNRLEVVGHLEVNPKTTCPGAHFLEGWKQDLVHTS